MRTFTARNAPHNHYDENVAERLYLLGLHAIRLGVEETAKPIHHHLLKANDKTAQVVRNHPDRVATNGHLSFFYDIKTSDTMEKAPYSIYREYWENLGCRVYLFIRNKQTREFFVPIQNVFLRKAWGHYPIDEHGWVAPREWRNPESKWFDPINGDRKYFSFLNRFGGSGTPFRAFDFEKMKQFEVTKDEKIIEILNF